MRFLLSRRWVVFALVVVLLAYLAWALGQWQFHRLDDRREANQVLARNLVADPAPVQDVLSVGRPPTADQEYLPVSATGSWDDARTIVLRYQTRDGAPGVDVVTPLRLSDGEAVLVDRGWLETTNNAERSADVPPAQEGEVTVTGYVRADAVGRATAVDDWSTRAISSRAADELTPYPLVQGFLDLSAESPEPAVVLEPRALPDPTSEGPHFFYGLQWWFFGALALFGFGYLAWDERRGGAARHARQDALRQRREATRSRRQAKAQEAEELAAWRYGQREDRPSS